MMYDYILLTLASLFLIDANIVPWNFIIVGIAFIAILGFVLWVLVRQTKKRKEMKHREHSRNH